MNVPVTVRQAAVVAPVRATASAPRGRRAAGVGSALLLTLCASLLAAVVLGPADISAAEITATVWAHLTGGDSGLSTIRDGIIWSGRMPRALTAAAVGGGLALCGVVMQALTRNPLADPYLLGLSSGASIGAVIVIVLGAAVALPVAAFIGALLALGLTLALSRTAGSSSPTSFVLAGLAVSSVLSALTSLVIFWRGTNDSYREILNWLLGSLGGIDWLDAALVGIALLVCTVPVLAAARALDSLALGETAAEALGIPVARVRVVLFVCTALLTGALVSVSGSIGFVGLILPHAVRAVVGSRHWVLLPISFLAGAIFLVWADIASRVLFEPRELPVGIVTALIGGPVFALLLFRSRRVRR